MVDRKLLIQSLSEYGIPKSRLTQLYKVHDRKFSPVPPGYPSPKVIADRLVGLEAQKSDALTGAADIAAGAISTELYKHPEYPWYWLDKELVHDLEITDRPDEIPKTIALPRCGVLVLPCNALRTSTGDVQLICYSLMTKAEATSNGISDAKEDYHLIWAALEDKLAFNGGGISMFLSDELLRVEYGNFEHSVEWTDKDDEDIERCTTVLLNILTYAQTNEPEVFKAQQTRKVGFGATSVRSIPLFIGKDYRSAVYTSRNRGGTHASPKVHWRRGHWKRVPIGKGGKERARRFIQPTLVNAKPEEVE